MDKTKKAKYFSLGKIILYENLFLWKKFTSDLWVSTLSSPQTTAWVQGVGITQKHFL